MGLFNIFNKKDGKENETVSIPMPVLEPAEAKENVENVSVTKETKDADKPLTVSYATGWPIDVVYGYLHKNYEEKGFQDAMLQSDLAFKNMNMSLIRNKILMVFREINLNYDVKKQDIQRRIDNCNASGLLTIVAQLEQTLQMIDAHKKELAELENDFRNNANEASIPLQSYECGFLRGIATVSLGGGLSQPVAQPQSVTQMQNGSNVSRMQSIA